MRKCVSSVIFHYILVMEMLLFIKTITGDRFDTVQISCGKDLEHNSSISVPNFIGTMEKISEQMQTSGFGIAMTGSGPDAIYGLAQCYGYLSPLDCGLCYQEVRTVLPQCYPYSNGRIYLDGCFMRVENYSFYDEFKGPGDKAVCGNLTRKNSTFRESARAAVMQAMAAAPSNKGYARAQVAVAGTMNQYAYALVDCWRNLNQDSCGDCLVNAWASVLRCLPWSEGRALTTGCFVRYSDTDFLNKVPENGSSKGRTIVIVVSVVSSIVVLVIGALIGHHIWKNRRIQKKSRGSNDAEKMVKTLHDSSLNFKYSILEKATGSFDESNKLGHGGFGAVYKGVLPDGREIAVKRLFFNRKNRAAEFYNEVNMVSSVEHKNLVRLLGCSCSGPENLLVYEYLPNKSLDRFIFDQTRGKALNWEKRYEIIIGTAEALVYLHENSKIRIIHRDIKASNILLDSSLRAKIADFGLARSFQEDKSHISTAIAGTLGYMAPEYFANGRLTEKADVYSFGVLILEIVTGRQNNRRETVEYTDSLVTLTWKYFQAGRVEELYDPNLMLHYYGDNKELKEEVLRVVHIGLLCIQEIASKRPLMSKALKMLTRDEENLPAPTKPPFLTMELNETLADPSYPLNGDDTAFVANVTKSSFYPR